MNTTVRTASRSRKAQVEADRLGDYLAAVDGGIYVAGVAESQENVGSLRGHFGTGPVQRISERRAGARSGCRRCPEQAEGR